MHTLQVIAIREVMPRAGLQADLFDSGKVVIAHAYTPNARRCLLTCWAGRRASMLAQLQNYLTHENRRFRGWDSTATPKKMTPGKLFFNVLVLIGQALVFGLDWSVEYRDTSHYINVGLVLGTGYFHVLFAGFMARATTFRKILRLVSSIGWLLLTILLFGIGDINRGSASADWDYVLVMSFSFFMTYRHPTSSMSYRLLRY